jgi:hypothetical protein
MDSRSHPGTDRVKQAPALATRQQQADELFDDASALFLSLYEDPFLWRGASPITAADRRAVARQLCLRDAEDSEVLSAAAERCAIEMRRIADLRTPATVTVTASGCSLCVRTSAFEARAAVKALGESGSAKLVTEEAGTIWLVRDNIAWIQVSEHEPESENEHEDQPENPHEDQPEDQPSYEERS